MSTVERVDNPSKPQLTTNEVILNHYGAALLYPGIRVNRRAGHLCALRSMRPWNSGPISCSGDSTWCAPASPCCRVTDLDPHDGLTAGAVLAASTDPVHFFVAEVRSG